MKTTPVLSKPVSKCCGGGVVPYYPDAFKPPVNTCSICGKKCIPEPLISKPEKTIRFRVGDKWGRWQSFDKKKIPKEVDAMETRELMTVREIEELRAKGVL